MIKSCEICGKSKQNGNSVSHSNIKTKRSFNANLQNIKVIINGNVKKRLVCTSCIKSNKVLKSK